jgi:hypothetical protein
MMAIEVANHVYIEVITIYEHSIAGNSVADDFIHGGTDALREMHVVNGTRICIMLDDELMNQLINVI